MNAETRRAIAASRLARFDSNESARPIQTQPRSRRASIVSIASTASLPDITPSVPEADPGSPTASLASTASLPGTPAPPAAESLEDEDDPDLQEAIRLSKLDYDEKIVPGRNVIPPTVSDRGIKRKFQDDFEDDTEDDYEGEYGFKSKRSRPSKSKARITWPRGALRITRTPGREYEKNCVNLKDVIQGDDLVSALCFSFFIGGDELYQHLPLSHDSDAVPIYIGRDANMDPGVHEAAQHDGINVDGKISRKQLQDMLPRLQSLYEKNYGKNYHAFYAWSPGSSHSKIMVLVYRDFVRLVITSCNLMDIDTVGGDNHWYIHDLPKKEKRGAAGTFETDFLAHLQALSTPEKFIDSIRGWYDYSKVEVHLVTSQSGVQSGIKAVKHGLLRFRRIVQGLDLGLIKKAAEGKLQIDVCAASIGNLNANWLTGFYDCVLGADNVHADGNTVPPIRLFYPSVNDVKGSAVDAQQAASNIGCHTRPWENAPKAVQDIFHHYVSKDSGRLFHQKLILAHNPSHPEELPYYLYVGSANLSQSAWGGIEADKKGIFEADYKKLTKASNFECGIVIPGRLIMGLLEEGVEKWQDGVIPFVLEGEKYDLSKERPWNDPRWVKDRDG